MCIILRCAALHCSIARRFHRLIDMRWFKGGLSKTKWHIERSVCLGGVDRWRRVGRPAPLSAPGL